MRTKHMSKIYLSIVVPVFNEEKRIKNLIKIDTSLQKLPRAIEIIVVNDGSSDKTMEVLERLSVKTQVKIISYRKNRGKGHAVKKGMLAARGRYRLFMDIDLSTPLTEIPKFLKKVEDGDVVIGSRRIKGAKVVDHQSLIRELLGRSFTRLSRMTLGLSISDFTCGFKCFSEDAAINIFRRVSIDRWGFDSEILFLAKKLGYSVLEVPVEWNNDRNTKVKFPQDILRSLRDLVNIRLNGLKGVYT